MTHKRTPASPEPVLIKKHKLTLFHSVPALVAYIDTELNYQYVNKTYEKWYGVSPEGILGRNMVEITGKNGFRKIKKYIDMVLSGKQVQFETEIHYPADTRFIHVTYVPDADENGNVTGFLSFMNDISEQKLAERVWGKKHAKADATLKALSLVAYEQKCRQLIEILPAAVYTCDAEGFITFYNEAAARMWGRNPEIGQDMWCGSWKIFDPRNGSSMPLEACPMAVALKEQRMVEGEEIIVERPDGSRFYVLPHPQPLYDIDGKMIGAVNLLLDITPRKQIEKILGEARKTIDKNGQDLQHIIESIPQLAWTSQPDGKVIYVNKAWYDFTSDQDLSGHNWQKHIYRDDYQHTCKAWERSLANGEPFETEYRLVRHDGVWRWMLGRANPIKNHDGKIRMWIGTATDIHEQKMLHDKKDEFIGIASQELKTPLTCLKAYNQLLERALAHPKPLIAKQYVQKTGEYIEILNNLISDLLDVTRIQAGKLPLSVSEFDFDSFAKENVEWLKQTHPSHQLIIEGQTNVKIKGDKQRLEQVFMNYVLNAIKYSPKANRVIVSLAAENGHVQVAVKDFGIGIPQENIKHLFTRFYKVESQPPNFRGLGLGLYISSEIIQRHGGKTWAESRVNKGSTFYFTVPRV